MAKARKTKQLSFSMSDRVGLLSLVSSTITKAKINITAICAYGMENKAYFMMATDSNAKAKKALTPLGIGIQEEDVVAVEMPNKVGELQKIAQRIADSGINIEYMYGTAGTGKTSVCVFKTADDAKAIRVINKK